MESLLLIHKAHQQGAHPVEKLYTWLPLAKCNLQGICQITFMWLHKAHSID